MSARKLNTRWMSTIRRICPDLPRTICKTLSAISLAMARARSSQMSRIALHLPRATATRTASALSKQRRIERFVANDRVDADEIAARFTLHTLQQVCRRKRVHLRLMLDETPNGEALRVLKLSLATHGRAIPLLWTTYRTDAPPQSVPELAQALLERFARVLGRLPCKRRPHKVVVTMTTDRGLAWPVLLDFCRARGWHFLMRVQGQTRIQLPDETQRRIDELVPQPGARFQAQAKAFKAAGWRPVYVCAHWPKESKQPWLLISSWPARTWLHAWYRRRMWQEESFRDEKSQGFHWQQSRIRDPDHAHRLLLALAVAQLWMISLGHYVQTHGLTRLFERKGRKELSIFQRGLRFFEYALANGLAIPTCLHLPRAPLPPPLASEP